MIHRGVDCRRVRSRHGSHPSGSPRCARAGASTRHARVILQAARLTAWKGQGVLIDAAARLQQRRAARRCRRRAGRRRRRAAMPMWRRCRLRLHALGLDGSVRLVGHVERHGGGLPRRARHGGRLDRARGLRPDRHRGGGHGLPGDRHRHRRAAGDGAGRAAADRAGCHDRLAGRRRAMSEALAEQPGRGAGADSCRRAPRWPCRARRHVLAHFTVEAMQRQHARRLRPAARDRPCNGGSEAVRRRGNSATSRPQRS